MDCKPYDYEFSPLAEKDLNNIFEYIALELSSPEAAEHLIDRIQDAVERLCDFPFSCPLLTDSTLQKKGYRLLVVQNFNLFYVVEKQTVIIRRILYGRRDYESIL